MKDILIINLTRMGDLLQTTPLMEGLKKKYPHARITLLVSSAFTEICKGIPFIDDLISFDMQGYRDRIVRQQHSLVSNFNFLKGLIDRINKRHYDLAMNLTHSPISALIVSLTNVREIRGFTVDPEGHRVIRHPWLRYFFNVVPNREYNPFHLVDMYIKAGGVRPLSGQLTFDVSKENMERSGTLLKEAGADGDEMLVGIHLGASKSDKTWPVESFANLADIISGAYGARIILFGSPAEADLGKRFGQLARSRHLNFIGRTNLGELAALLKRCRLLISNDTGPLHLATAVGTKVLDIFTANVHFHETAPYGEGHYVIQADLPCVPCAFNVECNNPVCKDAITPKKVFAVVREAIEGGSFPVSGDDHEWNNIQVYRTYFTEIGYLGFYPLLKKQLRKDVVYRTVYRELWNEVPGGTNTGPEAEGGRIWRELSGGYLMDSAGDIAASIKKDLEALKQLIILSDRGAALADSVRKEARKETPEISKLQEISGLIESTDRDIETTGHVNPCLRILTVTFAFARESVEGTDVAALAEETGKHYRDLLTRGANMKRILEVMIAFLAREEGKGTEHKEERTHGTTCGMQSVGYTV